MRLLLVVAAALSLCSLPTIQADEETLMPEAFETKIQFVDQEKVQENILVTGDLAETKNPQYLENEATKIPILYEPYYNEKPDKNFDNGETMIPDVRYKETQQPNSNPCYENPEACYRNKNVTDIDPNDLPPNLRGKPRLVKRLQRKDPEKLDEIIQNYAKRLKNKGKKRGRGKVMKRTTRNRPPLKNGPVRVRKPYTFGEG
jgi:hypothetical protein